MIRFLPIIMAGLLLLSLSSCGEEEESSPPPFDRSHTSTELEKATIDIVGSPPGEAGLDEVEVRMRASVRDMSRLSEAGYIREYDRSPQDQAALIGTWLGLAENELTGRGKRIGELALELSAAAPNERSDNPRNPGAENARLLLQSAFAQTRE